MRRQLPQIAQRLQITLDKLSSDVGSAAEEISAQKWWGALKQRFAYEPVSFADPTQVLDERATLPAELFDSVSDNLLQNALHKGRLADGLSITVSFEAVDNGFVLAVSDDGEPMSDSVAQRLFDAPVSSSKTGLGVGLYQAYRYARERRYDLRLASNEPGRVCFELAPLNAR